jgi:hypothetical protein
VGVGVTVAVTSDSALLEQPASTSDALKPISPTVMNLLRIMGLLNVVDLLLAVYATFIKQEVNCALVG